MDAARAGEVIGSSGVATGSGRRPFGLVVPYIASCAVTSCGHAIRSVSKCGSGKGGSCWSCASILSVESSGPGYPLVQSAESSAPSVMARSEKLCIMLTLLGKMVLVDCDLGGSAGMCLRGWIIECRCTGVAGSRFGISENMLCGAYGGVYTTLVALSRSK